MEQNPASGSQIEVTVEEETMKSTLREALLGPSIVAVALGTMVVGSAARANATLSDSVPTIAMEAPIQKPLQANGIAQPSDNEAFAVTASAIKATYERGETPQFTIEIQNTSDKEATLVTGSGQKFDFAAHKIGADGKAEAKATWKWSADKMFTMALVTKKLAPGEKQSFKATWPEAPAGKFEIRGLITANGGIEAAPFIIDIK